MKKILITMAVLTGMVAGAMMFSSFTAPKQNAQKKCMQTEVNVPIYWEGTAQNAGLNSKIYIKVYRQCNSFYAVDKEGNEYSVKENPYYAPEKRQRGFIETQKYYISKGQNYYFNM